MLRDDHAVSVEHQLVLTSDQIADRERRPGLPCPILHHPLPIRPPSTVVRRGGRIDDQARAGERLHRGGWPRVPDVLADRQPDPDSGDVDQGRGVARLEVAALIEDAVVRKQDLPVDAADLPVPEHGDGVVGARIALRKADQGHGRPDPGGDLIHGVPGGIEEVRLQPQVLGGVARDRLLRENHQLRARLPGVRDPRRDQSRIALDVSHRGVHLGERDAQLDPVAGHQQEYALAPLRLMPGAG